MPTKIEENASVSNAQFSEKNMRYDVLMLDARLRQSLATVRSLGSRGLRVAALATRETPLVPAFSSRWCQQKFICPAPEGTQEYLYLRQVLETTRPRVLIPAADGTIELLRQHRTELEQYTRLALAKEPGLGIAVNKEQTLRIAQSLGIDIPKGVTIKAGNEAEDIE